MSNKKRKVFILLAVLFTSILLAAATSMHFYSIKAENGKIREAMDALPRQPSTHMPQPDSQKKEAAAEKTEFEKVKMKEVKRNESINPDIEKAVMLTDIYSENNKDAIFRCFNKEASSYTWEIYDWEETDWKPAPEEAVSMGSDELGREISWLKVSGSEETTVRCILGYPEKKSETQTASLYLLKSNIEKITANDYETDPGTYVCIENIPITVTYEDQTEETLTGLNGLFFIAKEEKTDRKTGMGGNQKETTITTISECSYIRIGSEEKEVKLQYNGSEGRQLETIFTIKGDDSQPPVISAVEIAPFTISNTDIPVTLTVAIDAEDNKTLSQRMDYAFALKGTPPEEIQWMKKNSFDVDIVQNGFHTAFARDEAGNFAEKEMEVITVDTKPPEIQVSLKNSTGWCKNNEIQVDAKDASELQYSFRHTDDAIVPEWSDCHTYTIERNGTYVVKVKDMAGNIAETEITVSNIDREAPVIQGIYEK